MKAINDLHDAKMALINLEHSERITRIKVTAVIALACLTLIIAFV